MQPVYLSHPFYDLTYLHKPFSLSKSVFICRNVESFATHSSSSHSQPKISSHTSSSPNIPQKPSVSESVVLCRNISFLDEHLGLVTSSQSQPLYIWQIDFDPMYFQKPLPLSKPSWLCSKVEESSDGWFTEIASDITKKQDMDSNLNIIIFIIEKEGINYTSRFLQWRCALPVF